MTILTICLSPGLQRTVTIGSLTIGEVNRLQSVAIDVAGKGVNVCRVLQRLGLDPVCLGQGGDNADEILDLARNEGLNLHLIPSSGRLRTCTSIVELTPPSGRRVTELVEPTAPVEAKCVAAMDRAFEDHLRTATALVIAGSIAPGFPSGYQTRLAAAARDRGIPVIVDLQGVALRDVMTTRPTLVKINLAEFAAAFLDTSFAGGEHSGILAEDTVGEALRKAVISIVQRYPTTTFVLTRGAKSVLAAQGNFLQEFGVSALSPSETLSTIGCGDTFLAGLVAKLLASDQLSTRVANAPGELGPAIEFGAICAQASARTLSPGVMDVGTQPRL